jgi:endo-1,4-beta-xylanase
MQRSIDVDVLPARLQGTSADMRRSEAAAPALNPYVNGLPESVQQELARRYAELFAVFLKHRGTVSRVTFWGVTDGDSWLNNWPIRGRSSYPLLFDRAGRPKPAYDAVIDVAKGLSGSGTPGLQPTAR